MKGKVIRGSGFRGVLNYVLDETKEARIVGGNMTGQNAKALAKEFANVRQLRSDCVKPVLHIPLRLPEGEDVSDTRWFEMAVFFLKLMQLSPNRPWVIVKHVKNHIHLVTSRVDCRGKIWTGKWEGLRCIEATQEIERHFGLTITPGLNGQNKKQVRLTSGQIKKISREMDRGQEPEIPAKIAIAERIQTSIDQSNGTFSDFKARLEKLGVVVKLNVAKNTDHISGVSFEFEGISMKGSKVARTYGWQGINQLLAQRKNIHENSSIARPIIESSPKPDERRAAQSKPATVAQWTEPLRIQPATGSLRTSPPVPSFACGDSNGVAGALPDMFLAMLGKPPVTTANGAITEAIRRPAGTISSTEGNSSIARKGAVENLEEDDEPSVATDGPAMSL